VPQGDRAFISYSREDEVFALRLASDLKAAGANVWLDQLDIVPGDKWDRSVENALADCPRMLLILSPASVKSENVMDEVYFALGKQKQLIPVVYQECNVPFRLSRIQQVDFRNDYVQALQALLRAIAPTKVSHEGNRAIIEDATTKTPEREELEETPRKGVQGRANRKDPKDALRETKPDFSFPWASVDHAPAAIRNPAILVTNINSVTSSELSWLVKDCKDTGKLPVFVAPSIDPSVARLMKSLGGLAIRATELRGQPLVELMEDIGTYLGGYPLLRESGFGFATREDDEEYSRGILCSFSQISKDDLCHARSVSTDGHSTRFEAQRPEPYISLRIKYLRYRSSRYAKSDAEFEGLCDRLRRFGADGPVSRRPIERVTFERSLEEVLLPAGFASWYFVTDTDQYICKIKKPKILVTTCPIVTRDQIIPALQQTVAQGDDGLVVFAPALHEDALGMMVKNRLRGVMRCLAVQTADAEQLLAVAQLTGAGLIDEANAKALLRDSVGAHFGVAGEIVAEIGKTKVKR
jgi:TIR domain-containing protein